ncbi:hypothetical protein [Kitasatospora sp. NPDC089509]|uniref:hypothetical protein n=1 Tax=Kitasatospora sp. NPDC089509 TaxID=3364079 RepID=UPI0037F3AA63
MTSLHPSSTDSALPGPTADGAGCPPPGGLPPVAGTAAADAPVAGPTAPEAPGPGAPGPAATLCAVAAAADGGTVCAPVAAGAPARHDSVPQPRTPEDVEAQLRRATADGDATTDRLRTAFTERLRAARAEGRSVAELAAACRRSVAEVRALLGEAADDPSVGAEEARATEGAGAVEETGAAEEAAGSGAFGGAGAGFVRFQQPTAPSEGNRPAPVPRSTHAEVRGLGSRRPSPSRRLRRMHPQTDRTGQEATARETAATDPTGAEPRGAGWAGEPTGATGVVADRAPLAGGRARPFTTSEFAAQEFAGPAVSGSTFVGPASAGPAFAGPAFAGPEFAASATRAEPPLGILIGGSPVQPEAVGRPEERTPVRVAAEPIRVGRGTSLVVLPSWRPAIAVSVSTEQLIAETGLTVEQLATTRLTVRMNPWALHDRELDLHGWEIGPAGPTGRARRGGNGGGNSARG